MSLPPWKTTLYDLLSQTEKETLLEAYRLSQIAAQEAYMAKAKALKQQDLQDQIKEINASLESPCLTFTLSDLSFDPTKEEELLIDFLRRNIGEEITISSKDKIFPTARLSFSAKLSWSLAIISSLQANGKFTATIQVPVD